MTDGQVFSILQKMPAFSRAHILADRGGVQLVESMKAENETELRTALDRWGDDCQLEVRRFPDSWLVIVTKTVVAGQF